MPAILKSSVKLPRDFLELKKCEFLTFHINSEPMRLLSAIALLLVQTLLFGQTQNNPIHSNLDQIGLEGVAKQNRRGSDVVRVFILAGQSNMQGQGKIYEGSNGAIGAVVSTFTPVCEDLEATSCDFTLNMVDGYGDGWNGWTYDFVQNGIALATETLENGTEGTATINLLNGVECEVIVNNAGAYGDELSWTLTNVDDAVIASLNGQQENYPSPNTLVDVMENDEDGIWPMLQIGEEEWMELDNAYIYFENGDGWRISKISLPSHKRTLHAMMSSTEEQLGLLIPNLFI